MPGVSLTGYIFGEGYAELQSNALAYVQATEVGGTHPALVEAMGRGACVIANDVPEHREVLGEAGLYYARNDPDGLARLMVRLVRDEDERERLGRAAAVRAEQSFSWDHVTDEYERLFNASRPTAAAVGDRSADHPSRSRASSGPIDRAEDVRGRAAPTSRSPRQCAPGTIVVTT